MVTTIERPKKRKEEPAAAAKPTTTAETPPSRSASYSDLSSRLAAVMATEKKKNGNAASTSPRTSLKAVKKTAEEEEQEKVVNNDKKEEEEADLGDTIAAAKDSPLVVDSPSVTTATDSPITAIDTPTAIDSPAAELLEKEAPKEDNKVEEKETNIKEESEAVMTVKEEADPEKVQQKEEDKAAENNTTQVEDVNLELTPTTANITTANGKKVEPKANKNSHKKKVKDEDKDRILEQRETQLFQAMENIAKLHDQIHQLQEAESDLKSKVAQLESEVEKSSSNTNSTKNAKRLETTIEDLKKQLTSKDEMVQGLMQEGEKLSKKELQHSTLIKKLRQEKLDGEKNITELTKKWEKATTDLSQASEKGAKQSETEKRLQESVKLLSDLTEQQTKHINKLESEKRENTKYTVETEAALKKALASIEEECNKAKLEAEQVNAAALEKEIKANDRLHKELTKLKESSDALEGRLRKEIRELQIALQTVEEQAGVREDNLRRDVADLQTRLQLSDNKMDEFSVDEATAPLLRQIEQLQTQHALAIKTRDQAEQR
jgi:hypothetical protein